MSLRGKTILVTRPRGQAGELVGEIERCGGRALVFPTITITDPDSWKECDRAIMQLDCYDAIVFTSVNGAKSFFERCEKNAVDTEPFKTCSVYAVGERTKREIESRGISVEFVPATYSSASLAQYFNEKRGKRFLIPCGNLAREEIVETLTSLGALVDTVTVYKTVLPDFNGTDELRHKLLEKEIDVITFASPSAAVNFATLLSAKNDLDVQSLSKIAVIGATTADAVAGLGMSIDIVASESTAKGLVEAIAAYYN